MLSSSALCCNCVPQDQAVFLSMQTKECPVLRQALGGISSLLLALRDYFKLWEMGSFKHTVLSYKVSVFALHIYAVSNAVLIFDIEMLLKCDFYFKGDKDL